MGKKENTPLWVFLAFSSIGTRKGALMLVWSCVAFTIYCVPWSVLLPNQQWAKGIFVIDDWSWFMMMVPILAWYWLSLRWADKNSAWDETA